MTDGAPLFAKVALALLTGGLGRWLWRSANDWKAKGEIPAVWNEGMNVPVRVGERGFSAFLVWQRFMSALLWFFFGLSAASIVLSDLLGLF